MKSERTTARITKRQKEALKRAESSSGLDTSDIVRLCIDGFLPELQRRFTLKPKGSK